MPTYIQLCLSKLPCLVFRVWCSIVSLEFKRFPLAIISCSIMSVAVEGGLALQKIVQELSLLLEAAEGAHWRLAVDSLHVECDFATTELDVLTHWFIGLRCCAG